MGTRMLLFPGEEHMHRAPSSWGGMHEPDVGNPPWMSGYNSQSSGGNTWSKRLAANSSNNSSTTNNNNNNNSDSDSWEVRAFAEDASTSGQWPPRSYSCSFCQREFRTAQALGGHMNVHRRERAQANQLAQLRSTGTEAHYPNNSNPHNVMINGNPSGSTPPSDHGHWPSRDSTSHVIDHQYGSSSSNPYDRYASSAAVDDSYLHSASYGAPPSYGAPTSYGAPSSPSFRNSDPYEYRSSYNTPPFDAGLDLELRLGQRYD